MKHKLTLALARTQLLMEVVRSAPSGGLHGLLRSLPFSGRVPSEGAAPQVVARAALSGSIPLDLRSRLKQAMADLISSYDGRLNGLQFEVRLGLDHARIGLMVLEDVAATALSGGTREAYAQAWVKQMLHLDPDTQVIRWQVMADARKLLISCVDRPVFETLRDLALEHRLRFVSCRPAVLSAIGAQQEVKAASKASRGLTVVWTEAGVDAVRSQSVQLLRFEGARLSSAWRGWVPSSPDSNGGDEALEGATHRFLAHNLAQPDDAVSHVHWPSIAPGASRVQ